MNAFKNLLIFVFIILIGFAEVKADNTMVDINNAIAIVSTAMGIKIVVEGDLKGQIPLDLDNQSPRQIKDSLEKLLNDAGFYWVSEGGIVHITRNRRGLRTLFGQQLPLSYYMGIIERNNLFRPLGIKPEETKTNLILTGIFGMGDNTRAIVEDTITHNSYYVSRGESVGNSKVVEITETHIILSDPAGSSVTLNIQQKGTKN